MNLPSDVASFRNTDPMRLDDCERASASCRSGVLISKVVAMTWPPRLQERPVILPLLGSDSQPRPQCQKNKHAHFDSARAPRALSNCEATCTLSRPSILKSMVSPISEVQRGTVHVPRSIAGHVSSSILGKDQWDEAEPFPQSHPGSKGG